MTGVSIALIVIVVLVVIVLIWAVAQYNGLVRLRNLVQEAWRQIDVELTRRHDLIPNLVETVKGYAAHERGVFDEVARARSLAASPASGPAEQAAHENVLTQAIGRLFAVAEAYPILRASENFQQLQAELTNTEDRIAAGRRFYNANVGDYNTRIEAFPSNLIASGFKFEKAGYFEVKDEQVRAVPQVSFGTIGSVAGEQAPPQMQPGAPSSGQIHPQMPGDQGNYPQQQIPGGYQQPQQQPPYQGQPGQYPGQYQGEPPVGGPPAGSPAPQDGQPPFTGGQ